MTGSMVGYGNSHSVYRSIGHSALTIPHIIATPHKEYISYHTCKLVNISPFPMRITYCTCLEGWSCFQLCRVHPQRPYIREMMHSALNL